MTTGVENTPEITALRKILALALRLRKTVPTSAAHLVRFCATAGVVPTVREMLAVEPVDDERADKLPTIRTCGGCAYCAATLEIDKGDDFTDLEYVHEQAPCELSAMRRTERDKPPPLWCPLRTQILDGVTGQLRTTPIPPNCIGTLVHPPNDICPRCDR